MFTFENKDVLVIGLGGSGAAASALLQSLGARVVAVDNASTPSLERQAEHLRQQGVTVFLGQKDLVDPRFDLAVLSPGVALTNSLVKAVQGKNIPLISELELGWELARCRTVAITGTNGKTTTTELVEQMLRYNNVKTVAAGNIGLPVSAVVEQAKNLDVLTLEVSSFQLETIKDFRPSIAILMNITPDHLDRYSGMDDYALAKARVFMNQEAFDFAVVETGALARLRELGAVIPSKVVTFSATDSKADLFLDRSLIVSRLPEWTGPLLDMNTCQLKGPHNAENLMAALAVGRILRLPLDGMVAALRQYRPAPHRCEFVAEIDGIRYVNDSKATNSDAVIKAIQTMPPGNEPGMPNIWLLAGGKDKGFDFHDVGPILSRRVKGAFVFGETRDKIRAAWGLFTACTPVSTLLEAVSDAAKKAAPGDVILLSPACSSFDQFQNYQHRGDVFRQAVLEMKKNRESGQASQASVMPGADAPGEVNKTV